MDAGAYQQPEPPPIPWAVAEPLEQPAERSFSGLLENYSKFGPEIAGNLCSNVDNLQQTAQELLKVLLS